jgi:cytochrome c oxidase subunit 2
MSGLPFLPPSASTVADELDILAAALLATTGAVLGLVVLLMLRFCAHYRKDNTGADRGHRVRKSWHWEVGWTAGSLAVFFGLYAWGANLYLREHRPPAAVTDIYVVAKQWMWKVEHPDGQREINALHVAVNRPVRLVMASQDVIHGFFVPAFRLKQDVVPGRYVSLWFEPDRIGVYRLFCSQLCGTDHAGMEGVVTVMSDGDFQKWLAANAAGGTLAARGGMLYRRLGCSGCHDAPSHATAPALTGLYGRRVVLRGGGSAVADESFVRQAMLTPAAQPIAGYPSAMPSFAGQLDEEQIVALVAYVKSLAAETPR